MVFIHKQKLLIKTLKKRVFLKADQIKLESPQLRKWARMQPRIHGGN